MTGSFSLSFHGLDVGVGVGDGLNEHEDDVDDE